MLKYLHNINNWNTYILKFYSKNKLCTLCAFTLSEILVAMSVMGILAAVLIPSIMQLAPDYNKVMFRKSLYNLQMAVNNMVKDQVNYPRDQMGTDASGATVERGFNYTDATTNGTKNKFCYFLTQQLNTMGTPYCPAAIGAGSSYSASEATAGGRFITSDGVSSRVLFINSDEAPNSEFPMSSYLSNAAVVWPVLVIMDVNGLKGPNCTATTGSWVASTVVQCSSMTDCSSDPDTFIFDIRYDGKIHVGGYHNGIAGSDKCAESILADPGNNKKGK